MDRHPFHAETSGRIEAPAARVFAHLDDHSRLSAHMAQRSWRMGWGRMELRLDERAGHAVGSHIALEGRAFGVRIALEEVVTEYAPPARKVWQTVGTPRLLVIGPYRMGFRIEAHPEHVMLTVFIDYALPDRGISRLLGRLFGRAYARWCCTRMVEDARAGLEPAATAAAASGRRVHGT